MAYTPKGVLAGDQVEPDYANLRLRDGKGRFVKASAPLRFRGAGGRFVSSDAFAPPRKSGVSLTPGRDDARLAINQQQIQRLIKRLSNFGKKVSGSVLRKALRAGAKLIQQEVKKNTPVLAKQQKKQHGRFNAAAGRKPAVVWNSRPRRSPLPVRGLLKRSWGVRVMKRKKDRTGMLVISGRLYGAAYYGRFVEDGTHSMRAGIKRQHRKGFAAQHGNQRIKPRKFISGAFKTMRGPALRTIRSHLRAGIAQAARSADSAGGGDG